MSSDDIRRVVGIWKRAVSALVVVAAATPALAQSTVVKMASLVPQGSAWHTTLLELAQEWKQLSGGKVTLRLYPGGVAGDDQDVVRKMRLGTLEAGVITSAGLSDIDRAVFALAVPMAYQSYEEFDYVLDKLSPQLDQAYEAKGFVVLGWADAGWVHFFSKTPARTPDDLKKLKLFTWSGDNQTVELWQSAGFNPVPLPSTEISTALQTGLVDALPTTPQAAVLLQWYTSAPYMNDVNWAVLLGATVIRKATWDKIPVELHQPLLEAARRACLKLRGQTRSSGVQDVEAMAKRGLKVVHVDEAARELWQRAAENAYPSLRGRFVPLAAYDGAMAARTEFRARGKAGD